jgi:protein TonB
VFTEYVCETPWENQSHRGWTALASFTLQALVVLALLLVPLVFASGLPSLQFILPLVAPAAAPPPPSGAAARTRANTMSQVTPDGRPIAPASIPHGVTAIEDQAPPIPPGTVGIVGGTGNSLTTNPIINSIATATAGMAPPLPLKPIVRPPRISRMMEAYLVHRVQPEYPPLARSARIQGQVLLHAIIARDGSIENLRVLSGHPMLVAAALSAVRQWRYRPYSLNGEPVEVETEITVNFVLSGG